MTRQCGDCQLCCKLLPMKHGSNDDNPEARAMFGHPKTIPDFFKPAGQRCQYQQHHKGCKVYDMRPLGCRIWNCRWLTGDDTEKLSRPDRTHYVIDILPDFVVAEQPGRDPIRIPVIQIWLDPDYPGAIEDPELKAYILRRGLEDCACLIRLDSRRAVTVLPPTLTGESKWHIVGGENIGPQWSTWPEHLRPE
jgi:hypothetical protein